MSEPGTFLLLPEPGKTPNLLCFGTSSSRTDVPPEQKDSSPCSVLAGLEKQVTISPGKSRRLLGRFYFLEAFNERCGFTSAGDLAQGGDPMAGREMGPLNTLPFRTLFLRRLQSGLGYHEMMAPSSTTFITKQISRLASKQSVRAGWVGALVLPAEVLTAGSAGRGRCSRWTPHPTVFLLRSTASPAYSVPAPCKH